MTRARSTARKTRRTAGRAVVEYQERKGLGSARVRAVPRAARKKRKK